MEVEVRQNVGGAVALRKGSSVDMCPFVQAQGELVYGVNGRRCGSQIGNQHRNINIFVEPGDIGKTTYVISEEIAARLSCPNARQHSKRFTNHCGFVGSAES
jgi:hypothetical protein